MRIERRQRRGNAAIWAVSLATLIAVAAIAVDLGYARSSDAQLDMIIDSSAYAGAGYLDGTDEGLDAAVEGAIALAAANKVNNTAVTITSDNVELGIWDQDAKSFTSSEDALLVNAVRVNGTQSGIATFFGRVAFGVTEMTVAGRSTAQRGELVGAGSTDCYLPLALPDCMFDEHGEDIQDLQVILNPSGLDTIGWARMNASPNASYSRDQINDTCADGIAEVGDPVYLQNGVVASALSAMATAIDGSDTVYDEEIWGVLPGQDAQSSVTNYGNTLEGAIILFDDDSYCEGTGGGWTGSETTTGFAWAAVYDVRNKGAAADKNVWLKIDISRDHVIGGSGGGSDHGILWQGPSKGVQ